MGWPKFDIDGAVVDVYVSELSWRTTVLDSLMSSWQSIDVNVIDVSHAGFTP